MNQQGMQKGKETKKYTQKQMWDLERLDFIPDLI